MRHRMTNDLPPGRKGGLTRRDLCLGVGGAALIFALGGSSTLPARALLRPPGGQDEERLMAACIRCERCIEACPQQVLVPARLEDSVFGVRMPTVAFDDGYCDFCEGENGGRPRCATACATGALSLPQDVQPTDAVIGKAVIVRDWCLAWVRFDGCRECYKACRGLYDAIVLNEYHCPEVNRQKCVGCGACQAACVSLGEYSVKPDAPTKAITVVSERGVDAYAARVERTSDSSSEGGVPHEA